jgi:hypothetical protein
MNMRAFVNHNFPYPWINAYCIYVEQFYQPDTLVFVFNESIFRVNPSEKN